MPNYYLSVLYKHIIQVENKNVGLKVGGHKHTIAPPVKKVGGHMPPLPPPPPPASYASDIYIYSEPKKKRPLTLLEHNLMKTNRGIIVIYVFKECSMMHRLVKTLWP